MTRRSVRDFKEGDIPPDDVEKILKAGVMAPSPGNSQPWQFHVIRGETKQKFVEVLKKTKTIPPLFQQLVIKGMGIVPVVVVVENPTLLPKEDITSQGPSIGMAACNKKKDITSLGSLLGTAACIENMLLAAHSLGYGSVWIGFPSIHEAIKKVIDIPGEIVSVLPIGHSVDNQIEYVNRSRKLVEEVTKFYN